MKLQYVLSHFKNVIPNPDGGYMALCPAHTDSDPSLSIDQANDGKILLKCFAECDTGDILKAAGLKWDDLFPERPKKKLRRTSGGRITNTYNYHNENGNLLFQVCRTADKRFFQRRPDGNGGWVNGLGGTKPVLYRLPQVLEAVKNGETVFIPEGEKDCNNLAALGLVATCNPMGAGKWREHYSDHLKGATCIILADNDNPGRKHAQQVAKSLFRKAASVKVIEFPDLPKKGDVSNWLEQQKGTPGEKKEKLLQLVAKTTKPHPGPVPPDQEQESPYFNKSTFIPKRLADELMSKYHFKLAAETLWVYQNGVYKQRGEQLAAEQSQILLGEATRTNRIKETIDYIKRATYAELPEPNLDVINLKNGRLEWRTGKLQKHDPFIFEIVQLPVAYDPGATCPEFDKYLETTLDPDVITLADEILGYCLIPDTRFEKAVMLTGSGRNGKSIFLNTLEALLGTANVSNVALQDLEENRFKAAGLLGKLANIFADLDSRALTSTTLLKMLSSGDPISAERKFGEPFDFKNYARMLFSANELPRSRDTSFAFYERWLIIPFNRTFTPDKADKNLRSKLTTPEELSGILNRALIGLYRLYKNNCFTVPAQVAEALEKYKQQNDSVAAFCAECIEEAQEEIITKADFYTAYCDWCEAKGLKAKSDNRVKESLIQVFPDIDEGRLPGNGPRYWKNIAYIGRDVLGDDSY